MFYSSPLSFLGFHALPRFFRDNISYPISQDCKVNCQTERFVLRIGVTLDSLDAKDIYDPSTMSARQIADSPHQSSILFQQGSHCCISSIFFSPSIIQHPNVTVLGSKDGDMHGLFPGKSAQKCPIFDPWATGSYRKSWSKWSTSWTRRSSHWAKWLAVPHVISG